MQVTIIGLVLALGRHPTPGVGYGGLVHLVVELHGVGQVVVGPWPLRLVILLIWGSRRRARRPDVRLHILIDGPVGLRGPRERLAHGPVHLVRVGDPGGALIPGSVPEQVPGARAHG